MSVLKINLSEYYIMAKKQYLISANMGYHIVCFFIF